MRIAVFANENASVCDFFDATQFLIWEKNTETWQQPTSIDFAQITPSSPLQIRKEMVAVLQLVKDCEIIAGGALTGIPYLVFDQAGKHIFQIDGVNDEILDGIIYDVEDVLFNPTAYEPHVCNPSAGCNATCQTKSIPPLPEPEEKSPGVYHFNLISAQRENPDISSKQALRGFMETTPFAELYLVCMHVPPWIERDFNVEREGVSCKITPK